MTDETHDGAPRATLEQEQRQALLLIASGAPMAECLDALTEAAGRLAPGTRACVLLAGSEQAGLAEDHRLHCAPALAAALRGQPLGAALLGACGTAIDDGRAIDCPDIERSLQAAPDWAALCREHGIRAAHAHPALGAGGRAVGAFFLCLGEAREAHAWERQVAEFGALATSIVVERDRAAAHQSAEVRALGRLQELSAELVGPGAFEPLLQKILAAAADISGTDKGNIQIYDPQRGTLRIVVHQGLGQRLVEHFREDGWIASCGAAARQLQRLVVEDVDTLESLRGTLGLEVVQQDQIRSIQCTPLMSRDGRLLGMLNNHYRRPGGPTPQALRYIDLLARQAAELIERHQHESELAEERRRKDEFLAMLAHELRNPLAPLRNMVELQKKAEGDWSVTRKAREVMERQVLLLVRLVDDLLDVNRINRGKLELRLEPVALDQVVHQAVEVSRPLLDQLGHRLQLLLPGQPARLRGDPARLTQVLGNLLTNAGKYTPPGGEITLALRAAGGWADISVRDNGAGIPPDQLERIFEPFTQVDRSLERAQGGLGIGLMLVQRLVQMHGGSVQARSAGLGQGSEFIVRLPLEPVDAAPPAPPAGAPSARGQRVLIVDDNLDGAESLALVLALDGYDARVAGSGEQALALGAELRPEVVLMDIGMPRMSGHEACRRLRQQPWGARIPVIALTGLGQDGDRRASTLAGFDAHLVKPVDLAVLRARLHELLGGGGRG